MQFHRKAFFVFVRKNWIASPFSPASRPAQNFFSQVFEGLRKSLIIENIPGLLQQEGFFLPFLPPKCITNFTVHSPAALRRLSGDSPAEVLQK